MISHMKSNLVDIFVKRPVISVVISLFICFAGIWAVKSIPVLQFPVIKSASLSITTTYTGASAKVVKGFVTDPIERIAATVPGVEYVNSSTGSGQSTVTAWLKLNQDSTLALAELNTRLNQIKSELPAGAENPVISVTRTDRPYAVFYLNVEAEGVSLAKLTDYLIREVNPRINNIDGVQRVGIEGARTPAMRIWLDSERMNIFNISADEVYGALASNNNISTLGYSETDQQRIDLVANTQLSSVDEFKQLIVQRNDDGIIYLKDIAKVALGSEQASKTARYNLQNSVYISVWPLPGANEIKIGDELYLVLDEINAVLPAGMHINLAHDDTNYMREALQEIVTTLFETIFLVGLVVLLLMGSWRSALVPLVTIPISILGAVAAISLMGFTLNLLTVLAIVLSVGLVVDDAIVVVENVSRHIRQGMPRTQAALVSSRQLLVPIISMTLTLAMVYAPIGFLSGLTGVLFKEFAFTLAIAVLISGLVAITLAPIMSAVVADEGGKEAPLTKKVNHLFERLQKYYTALLTKSFKWQSQLIVVAFVIGLLIIPFYLQSAKELAPLEDQNSISVVMQSAPESSLGYNEENMLPVVEGLLEIPGTKHMWQIITNQGGFGGLVFESSAKRDYTTMEKMPALYGQLATSTGLNNFPILPSPLPTAGQFDVELIVKSGESFEDMKQYADALVGAAFGTGKFLYADTDLKIDMPQMALNLDREKIADLGMQVGQVSQQLNTYLSSNYVNRFDADGKAYRVIPMLDNALASDSKKLLALSIKTPENELVPLGDFVNITWRTVPRDLSSFSQQNAFKIYGGVLPGVTKEQALFALEQAASTILPKSYTLDYAGESREIRKEGNSLITVMAISLLIVFFILAIQFNSFRDPLVIIFGCVPLALSGALLLPFFEFTSINIYSQIGLITLVGLIAKNGILIVEFANHLQVQGHDKLSAVIESASTRLRPILMTSMATILGHFPLVLVSGAGAEARNSIGIVLVSGMFIGTVFTLFILPTFYLWLATDRSVTEQKIFVEDNEKKLKLA